MPAWPRLSVSFVPRLAGVSVLSVFKNSVSFVPPACRGFRALRVKLSAPSVLNSPYPPCFRPPREMRQWQGSRGDILFIP